MVKPEQQWPKRETLSDEELEHTRQLMEQAEMHTLVRRFLAELDACRTERERMDKVMELVFGVVRGARRKENGGDSSAPVQ